MQKHHLCDNQLYHLQYLRVFDLNYYHHDICLCDNDDHDSLYDDGDDDEDDNYLYDDDDDDEDDNYLSMMIGWIMMMRVTMFHAKIIN